MINMSVALLLDDQTSERLAQLDLQSQFNDLPNVDSLSGWQGDYQYLLACIEGTLKLIPANKKLQPLLVDFTTGTMGYRAQQNVRNEMVVKAVLGRDKQTIPSVIDATAGLGRDSYLLAVLGCQVTMLERNPIVSALLSDGLARFLKQDEYGIAARMSLDKTDSNTALATIMTPVDVVYLDPMFPKREKSALVKKEMQIFKDIVGPDADSDGLLAAAKIVAKKRVVVKRSSKAGFLADAKPTYSLEGKSSRFDIYQC